MDLRERKTKKSITNAFLELRAHKPLERITVKELAELAEISKATFYLHYKDIYDLSETLQNEVIQNILNGITPPTDFLTNPSPFIHQLFHGFYGQKSLIDILFSGAQAQILPTRIEAELRSYITKLIPDIDTDYNILLTYTIQGGHNVYREYINKYGLDKVISIICMASEAISAANANRQK